MLVELSGETVEQREEGQKTVAGLAHNGETNVGEMTR